MSEARPFNGRHPAPATGRRLSTKATLGWFIAAALVVVSVAAVLVWWQVRDADSLAATGTDCVEDPTRIVDDEAGLSYCIPRDWCRSPRRKWRERSTRSTLRRQRHPARANGA
ncbi:hypothetical protein GCM10029992_16200 [Glycomyces albus]